MPDAVPVAEDNVRVRLLCSLEQLFHFMGATGIDAEDGAQIRMAGLHQAKSIFLRRCHRPFVRKDRAATKLLQANQSDQATSSLLSRARQPEGLLVEVDRGGPITNQHPLGLPLPKVLSRTAVPVSRGVVSFE